MYDESPPIYNINSFHQIGMIDPFPQEDVGFSPIIPELFSDHVYPEQRMCHADASPMCVYIPNRILTLKIIRACIDVKNPNDLWFNQKIEEDDGGKKKSPKGKKHDK